METIYTQPKTLLLKWEPHVQEDSRIVWDNATPSKTKNRRIMEPGGPKPQSYSVLFGLSQGLLYLIQVTAESRRGYRTSLDDIKSLWVPATKKAKWPSDNKDGSPRSQANTNASCACSTSATTNSHPYWHILFDGAPTCRSSSLLPLVTSPSVPAIFLYLKWH